MLGGGHPGGGGIRAEWPPTRRPGAPGSPRAVDDMRGFVTPRACCTVCPGGASDQGRAAASGRPIGRRAGRAISGRRRFGRPLRECSADTAHASAIPSTWRSPTARRPGGSPRRNRRPTRSALPLGRRVVALREVGGMARLPLHLPTVAGAPFGAIPETCPPGEGAPVGGSGSSGARLPASVGRARAVPRAPLAAHEGGAGGRGSFCGRAATNGRRHGGIAATRRWRCPMHRGWLRSG
jgi:hypothetical protein